MFIDFQHHYISVGLDKKRGLYSPTGLWSYIAVIRDLPLGGTIKEKILGDTEAELLKL